MSHRGNRCNEATQCCFKVSGNHSLRDFADISSFIVGYCDLCCSMLSEKLEGFAHAIDN